MPWPAPRHTAFPQPLFAIITGRNKANGLPARWIRELVLRLQLHRLWHTEGVTEAGPVPVGAVRMTIGERDAVVEGRENERRRARAVTGSDPPDPPFLGPTYSESETRLGRLKRERPAGE
jgi:hypothetical protein